jgi:hypothetical protein
MAMPLKRKKLTISEKVKIIQEVEKNPTVSQNETAKHFALPLLSLSNIILWKLQFLKRKVGVRHILRNGKKHENFAK